MVQISVTGPNGKRCQRKATKNPRTKARFASKLAASKYEFEFRKEVEAKLLGEIGNPTFSEWQRTFLNHFSTQLKVGTMMQYNGDLKKWTPQWFMNKRIKNISKDDLTTLIFREMKQKGATQFTQKRILKGIRRVLQYAYEEGVIARNPCIGIKVDIPERTKAVLNSSEASKLLLEAKRVEHRFYYIWAFALFSGLRNGELYGLRWTDVDLEGRKLRISSQWTNKDGYHSTKTSKVRVVPINDSLERVLKELRNIGPFEEELKGLKKTTVYFDDLVLPRLREWRNGEQAQVLREFCKAICITSVKFHDLRATFITNLLSQNTPTSVVMAIAGHSKLSSTEQYLRLAGIPVQGATDNLSFELPKQVYGTVLKMI